MSPLVIFTPPNSFAKTFLRPHPSERQAALNSERVKQYLVGASMKIGVVPGISSSIFPSKRKVKRDSSEIGTFGMQER